MPMPEEDKKRLKEMILFGIIIFLAVMLVLDRSRPEPDIAKGNKAYAYLAKSPSVKYVDRKQVITSGQLIVNAGQAIWSPIVVPTGSRNVHVTGNFSVSGGAGNDINAVITDQMNLTNWVNGHAAKCYWGTEGPETVGQFDVVLSPGTYYLAFSNKQSIISQKQVFVNAELNYQQMEVD